MNWYYHDGEKAVGPLSIEAIRQLRDCGMLAADTPLAPEGATEWESCEKVLMTIGAEPSPNSPDTSTPVPAGMISKVISGVGAAAGLDASMEAGGFRSLFKSTFKSRDIVEMESQFAVGTPATTPRLQEADVRMPAPWVFFRLIVASMVGTFGFYWALMRFANVKLIPGWIFMGAFGIPFAVLVFFMEVNVPRNVSFYRVLKLLMLGGLLSLVITLLLHDATGLGVLGPVSAGPIEETAKILALVFFMRKWKGMGWTLNGMLFGAAVGAGFAAFETAGYILEAFLGFIVGDGTHSAEIEAMMFGRAIWAPFTHVIWTAAAGGALWRVMAGRDFTFSMFSQWQFLRVFLLVVGLHSIWNSGLALPIVGSPWNHYIKYLLLGGIGWGLILLLLHDGLAQIRGACRSRSMENDGSHDSTGEATDDDPELPQAV
jgi:RsiW-degrading membrane proteinase PrsW (M82 family)